MKKTFYVPFAYEMYGRIPVEVDVEGLDDSSVRATVFSAAEDALAGSSYDEMASLAEYGISSEDIDPEGLVLDKSGNIVDFDC